MPDAPDRAAIHDWALPALSLECGVSLANAGEIADRISLLHPFTPAPPLFGAALLLLP